MRRREFITLFGGVAALAAGGARAAAGKAADHRIPGPIDGVGRPPGRIATFVQRLRELGWIEGRTVAIEFRWAEGNSARFAEFRGRARRPQGRCHCHLGERRPRSRSSTPLTVIPAVFAVVGGPGRQQVWSRAWRVPAATSQACRPQHADARRQAARDMREVVPNLHRLAIMANVEEFRRRAGDARVRDRRPAELGLEGHHFRKSGAPRISRPPSRRSRAGRQALLCQPATRS